MKYFMEKSLKIPVDKFSMKKNILKKKVKTLNYWMFHYDNHNLGVSNHCSCFFYKMFRIFVQHQYVS